MKKVVIFGTGTMSDIVSYYLENDSNHEVICYTSTDETLQSYNGKKHIPFDVIQDLYPPSEFEMFVAVGYRKMNSLREKFYTEAKSKGYKLLTYVHENVVRWPNVKIGNNCFIFEDNTVQPFSEIGNNVILWSGNHIGHHSTIGDHTFISSHVVISGQVKVGTNCFIGVNSSVRDGITIGNKNLIGAGAIIMKDTKDNDAYVPRRTELFPKTVNEIDF